MSRWCVLWNPLGFIGGPLPDETVRAFLPGVTMPRCGESYREPSPGASASPPRSCPEARPLVDPDLQADNAHDTLSIVRRSRDGTRHTIAIPGLAGISPNIVTASHGRLLLESAIGSGGPSSLFWFDPATRATRFLIRTPPAIYGVAGAIPYRSRTC